jgi:ATP/maltotriose-dependent transcriptional regulator MalT
MMRRVSVPVDERLAEARAALRVGDGAAARQALADVSVDPASAPVLEALARAAYLELDFRGAIERWEEAYAAYRESSDDVGAVRVGRTLAGMYYSVVGDRAVSSGWMARAQTLLADAPETSEGGWVALNIGMFENDRSRKEARFREALAAARRHHDADLEFATLAYLGASLVHGDRHEEGMLLLDEALAAVAGNEVEDFFVLEEIFCQLFAACEHAGDVARADEWIRVGEAIAQRRGLPAVSAFCHTHYGGVLTAAGRWSEADAALTDAIRVWSLGQRSVLRGGALARLAELRIRQGRVDEAAQLLEGVDPSLDLDVVRPVAAVHLARGELPLAREVLERGLEQLDPASSAVAPFLAMLVEVHLAAGDLDAANAAAERLAANASRHGSPHMYATAALARGRICLASGAGDPHACLREALTGFARSRLPLETARARLELANALASEQPEVAVAEARSALEAFERLCAARDADAAAALLRSLGVRTPAVRRVDGVLTKREAEVLDLVGRGLSNPQIGERLYISRKTVEHHVGNILMKLGLRSRAEAAAYAARAEPASR